MAALAGSIARRYARALFSLGVDESDVLDRCHRGLLDAASGVSRPEAGWVVQRLAELLEWRFEGLAGA